VPRFDAAIPTPPEPRLCCIKTSSAATCTRRDRRGPD
jgi:hypothetical protein